MIRATEFEFKNRWWLFGCLFGVPFSLFSIDHTPMGVRVARLIAASTQWPTGPTMRMVFAVSALLMIVAGLVRTWGSAYLGREVVHDHAVHSEVLHADGPYRQVRNPLYLGNILMTWSLALLAPALASPIIVIGVTVFCYRLIGREEAELEAGQGESFRAYMRAVPRLWPAMSPRIPSANRTPDWINGLSAEAYFWSFVVGVVLFAITLQPKYFYAGLILSPVFSWIAGLLLGKARSDSQAATR